MKVLAWNCRGAGSPLTIPYLKEVIHLHSPDIIFLSETKNKKNFMNKVLKQIGFDDLFCIDPIGKSGGLSVMWKKETQIEKILFTQFTIELKFPAFNDVEPW